MTIYNRFFFYADFHTRQSHNITNGSRDIYYFDVMV